MYQMQLRTAVFEMYASTISLCERHQSLSHGS